MVVMQYLEDSVSLVEFLRKDEEKEKKIRVLNQVKEAAKVRVDWPAMEAVWVIVNSS